MTGLPLHIADLETAQGVPQSRGFTLLEATAGMMEGCGIPLVVINTNTDNPFQNTAQALVLGAQFLGILQGVIIAQGHGGLGGLFPQSGLPCIQGKSQIVFVGRKGDNRSQGKTEYQKESGKHQGKSRKLHHRCLWGMLISCDLRQITNTLSTEKEDPDFRYFTPIFENIVAGSYSRQEYSSRRNRIRSKTGLKCRNLMKINKLDF